MKTYAVTVVVKEYRTVTVELEEGQDMDIAVAEQLLTSDDWDYSGIREVRRPEPNEHPYEVCVTCKDDYLDVTCQVYAPDTSAAIERAEAIVDPFMRIRDSNAYEVADFAEED